MKKARFMCLIVLAAALLLTGCSGFTMSVTTSGSKTTIKVNNAADGDSMETNPSSVGKGRVCVVESSLDKGELRIDFAEAHVFSYEDDDYTVGDVVKSVTVGPGDREEFDLEKGDYVLQITSVGDTNGKVTVNFEKK
ncbi:MAG: hypothetical protein IJL71_02905 [Oscillospiraceae bacterium]|nr:hypothetical protein [Oscillospiraceae bacterium]